MLKDMARLYDLLDFWDFGNIQITQENGDEHNLACAKFETTKRSYRYIRKYSPRLLLADPTVTDLKLAILKARLNLDLKRHGYKLRTFEYLGDHKYVIRVVCKVPEK